MLSVSIGTVVWTTIAFLVVLFILKKFAWKPILSSIKEREDSIDEALEAAEKARRDIAKLKSDNEDLIKQAREERDDILKQARSTKEKMIGEAKGKAQQEADKMIKNAKESIENEKMQAITELKNQVASLSIEIAEKILREELDSQEKQKKLAENLIKEVSLN